MKNKLKEKLGNGETAIGSWIGLSDPYAVEAIGDMGFDWLLIDTEHWPIGRETLRTILLALKGSASVPVVRVADGTREHCQTALDLGAQGIMIPMVSSAEDVAHAVQLCRYPPQGQRGFGPVRASRYLAKIDEYRNEVNDELPLFVQLETPTAIENAREILNCSGIDGAFIGPGDLASFMNVRGGAEHPRIQSLIQELLGIAAQSGIAVGLPSWSSRECNQYMEWGARLLTVGSDLHFLMDSARTYLADARALTGALRAAVADGHQKH